MVYIVLYGALLSYTYTLQASQALDCKDSQVAQNLIVTQVLFMETWVAYVAYTHCGRGTVVVCQHVHFLVLGTLTRSYMPVI